MPVTLFDGVTLTVEAALSAATGTYGAWNAGLWDTATWGPDEIWVDVSADFRSLSTQRRFSRDLQTWESGTGTLVLNNFKGDYAPGNLSGKYVTAGITQIRPWRAIRVKATYAGVTYPVYRGYALDFLESYEKPFPGGGGAYVTIPLTDEFGSIARINGSPITAVGSGETSGLRIHRLLNAASHTGTRDIAVGTVTLQPTTMSTNRLTELKLTSDSEGGAIWVDADGTVIFVDRYAFLESTRSNTIQVTYGDGPGEMPYSEVQMSYAGGLLANMAAYSRVGGTPQTATDESSRALYGDSMPPEASRTDLLCEEDAQVAGLASLYVTSHAQPEDRVALALIRPRHDPRRMFPDLLGRKVRDLVRVKRRPPGGYTNTRDNFVAGISHTVTRDNWTATLEFASATPWTSFSSSRWNSGVWDTATFFY